MVLEWPRSLAAVAEEMKLPLIRTPMITMNWINLATLAIDNEFAPQGTEHATTLDIKGVGVMLRARRCRARDARAGRSPRREARARSLRASLCETSPPIVRRSGAVPSETRPAVRPDRAALVCLPALAARPEPRRAELRPIQAGRRLAEHELARLRRVHEQASTA